MGRGLELGDGGGREIEVEEAVEDGVEGRGGGAWGEGDGDLGIGGEEGGTGLGGGARDDELGCGEGVEGLGERKALVEEEADGEDAGSGGGDGLGKGVADGRVEDESGGITVIEGEMGSEGGADAEAVGDDLARGDVVLGGEIAPGELGVDLHGLFGGVLAEAGAVAAVVEGEDVGAGGVEGGEKGDVCGEGRVAAAEDEDGDLGVAAAAGRGEVPAGELRGGGGIGGEVDEAAAERSGSGGLAAGVEDELPLAQVEEDAEGDVAAEEGHAEDDGDGFDEPAGVDIDGWRTWRLTATGGGGCGHDGGARRLGRRGPGYSGV